MEAGRLNVDQEAYERATAQEAENMDQYREIKVRHSHVIAGLQAKFNRTLTAEEMDAVKNHIVTVMNDAEAHWALVEGQTLGYVVRGVEAIMVPK